MPNMPRLPPNVKVYKATRTFDESTVPDALRRSHSTKAGTWGRIVVREGQLRYTLTDDTASTWVLRPGLDGIIEPTVPHEVEPVGAVRFVVEFLRAEN